MLAISRATPSEFEAIVGIAPASAARQAVIAEWLAAGQVHVARVDGVPAGYAAFTRNWFRSAFLELLIVGMPFRRQGIGLALVEHCIALTPPGEKFWTSTNQSNLPMQGLLAGLGLTYAGMFEHLDPGDPELIYLKWPAGQEPA